MHAALLPPLALSGGGIAGFAVLYVLIFLFLGIRSIKRGPRIPMPGTVHGA